VKIFAHRGYSAEYPENTMLAFKKAVEAGCDGIQIDLHFSRDRYLMIIHDQSLSRMTDAIGFVRHHAASDLKNYNIKGAYSGETQHIPSLSDYFDWAKDMPFSTIIELKNDQFQYPEMEDELIRQVLRFDMADKVMLTSRRFSSVEELKRRWPHIRAGLTMESGDLDALESLIHAHGDFVIVPIDRLDDAFVEACRNAELAIYPSNLLTKRDYARAEAFGCTLLLTTNVDKAREVLQIDQKPFTDEELGLRQASETAQMTAKDKLRMARNQPAIKSGALGIVVGVIISIGAAVGITALAMRLIRPFFK